MSVGMTDRENTDALLRRLIIQEHAYYWRRARQCEARGLTERAAVYRDAAERMLRLLRALSEPPPAVPWYERVLGWVSGILWRGGMRNGR